MVKYQHLIVECVMYVMLVVLTLIPHHIQMLSDNAAELDAMR